MSIPASISPVTVTWAIQIYFTVKAFNSASDSVMSRNMAVNNDLNFSRAILAFSKINFLKKYPTNSKSYLHRTFFSFSYKKKRICFHRLRKGKIVYLLALI